MLVGARTVKLIKHPTNWLASLPVGCLGGITALFELGRFSYSIDHIVFVSLKHEEFYVTACSAHQAGAVREAGSCCVAWALAGQLARTAGPHNTWYQPR